jgi:hypothetical protein
MSHYQLSESYGNTPEEWRKFLRDNHLFIESELAAITEAEARSALSRLGNAGGTEVTALKALLDKSKLINDAQRQNVKVVMTFIPSNEEELQKDDVKPNTGLSSNRPNFPRSEPTSRPIPQKQEKPERISKYR